MTQYAKLERKSAPLCEKFGYDFAVSLFGKETIDGLPRFVRGKNKGYIKGFVVWEKCHTGGWAREYAGVAKPGTAWAWVGGYPLAPYGSALSGAWYGRTQQLAGAAHVFTEAYATHVKAEAVEQAAALAELEEAYYRRHPEERL